MKVIFIGGGVISGKLKSDCPPDADCRVFGIRSLEAGSDHWPILLQECAGADVILYLAYHHQSVAANLRTLKRVLSHLKAQNWAGRFVFFNTQLTLPQGIFESSKPLPWILRWDPYTLTKRRQSSVLQRYAGSLSICELFLPVVVGSGTQWSQRLQFIASHPVVNLPHSGNCSFASLNLNSLSRWFWSLPPSAIPPGQLFVYEEVLSYRHALETICDTKGAPKVRINEFQHRFRFASGAKANLLTSVRLSPLSIPIGALAKRLRKSRPAPNPAASTAALAPAPTPQGAFTPIGSEYQFFGESLKLDAIPCRREKVA